ncbi:MAG: phage terminase large subunit family protein, partial [Candidatus Omnitrophica bacterium]|nr:phage terminase large subunit family protein [Candidatus Omnitrophota bacterium]
NGRDHKNNPFNPMDYPWCEGICDAWDDRHVRRIALQFAARLGKTTLAINLMCSSLEYDPETAMYGTSTKTLVEETVRDKYYKVLENMPPTRTLIPRPSDRVAARIDLATCKVYCAWAGSTTSLADKDPRYKHAGEIDKWSKRLSEEADPFQLFMERGKEIPNRKELVESTPSITHRSRIERELINGWNCRFHVPCPKCGKYNQLIMGKGPSTGGIIFDKDEDGRINPSTAAETARYMCPDCGKEWGDEHRRRQIRKGRWCPEGCVVWRNGRVRGAMANPGPYASFQLSRLYAPTFNFGDIARDFAEALLDKDLMQNFVNSTLAETYLPKQNKKTWEEIGERLCDESPKDVVPADR